MVLQGFAEQLRHPQRRKITRCGVELRGSMSKAWVPSQVPGEIHRSDERLEECVAENHTGSDIGCSNPWGQNSQTRHPATQRIQTQFLFHWVRTSVTLLWPSHGLKGTRATARRKRKLKLKVVFVDFADF